MGRVGVIFLKQHSKQRISIILIKYQGHYEKANNIQFNSSIHEEDKFHRAIL
jgi:mevalonate pyrophosphate decarboxylase